MKKITLFFSSIFLLTMLLNVSIEAQELPIPADQAVVVLDETIPGKLETIINGDIDEDGNRVNPNRIYLLKKGAVYVQVSAIQFNAGTDTDAVLNIFGEEGGAKAMVIMNPGAGVGKYSNTVTGSLTLKNVYWGGTNMNGESTTIFSVNGGDQRIIADGLMVENMFGGAVFGCGGVSGELDAYLKNCYFRDNSQMENSWNHSVIQRGDNGEPFDTLWVENTTVNFSSMPFFGKMTPVNFFFFNHNICMNGAKYPIWFERFQEAYITSNMFINSNFEGECRSTYETQIAEDFIKGGIVNLDTVEAAWFSPSITPEDVIFYSADNLSYTSEYLDKYWAGGYNTVADHPISNRVWGSVTADDLPLQVFGPIPLHNDRTLGLAAAYDNVKIERAHDNVNPEMITKGIKNQDVGNQFAIFARINYGVAEVGEVHDKSKMYFGDADPATIPGGGTENGYSIKDMTDLPEDFSYTADIITEIDSLHLGSLAWYPDEFPLYNSEDQLQRAKDAYNGIFHNKPAGPTGILDRTMNSNKLKVYPNPANSQFSVSSDASTLTIYSILGQQMMLINEYMSDTPISTSSLEKGIYIISNGKQMQKLVVE